MLKEIFYSTLMIASIFSFPNEKEVVGLAAESPKQSKLVIIDTDGGSDDVVAIMLASNLHKKGLIKILAITTSYGNTEIDNVNKNVFRALNISNIEKVKVYEGAHTPIVNVHIQDGFFGDDGLGNSTHDMPPIDAPIESEHAVYALSSLAKQYPKQITIMALGPVTNLALAHLIDHKFLENLQGITLMGGTISAFGNAGPNLEFNFVNDPEAVHVVLSNADCSITIIPWETCYKHMIPWEIYEQLIQINTEKAKFFGVINRLIYKRYLDGNEDEPGLTICDSLVVVAEGYPKYIRKAEKFPAEIELHGNLTRGQLVVDRRQRFDPNNSVGTDQFIISFNQTKLMGLIRNLLM